MNNLYHLGFRQPGNTCPPPSNSYKFPINANKVEEAASRAKVTAYCFNFIIHKITMQPKTKTD